MKQLHHKIIPYLSNRTLYTLLLKQDDFVNKCSSIVEEKVREVYLNIKWSLLENL